MAEIGPIVLRERDVMRHATVEVVVRADWRVRAGLLLMRMGAWLAGAGYHEATDG